MSENERVLTKAALLRKTRAPLEVVVHESRKKKETAGSESVDIDIPVTQHRTTSSVKPVNLKNTRFEIMKFAMSGNKAHEKEDAQVALAIKLGAIPPKNKYINYKELKDQKRQQLIEARKSEKMQTLGKILKTTGRKQMSHGSGHKKGGGGILGQYGKVSKAMVAKTGKKGKRK